MTGDSSPQSTTGSGLLLRKLPIVARARVLAKQRPCDPQAECNALSYGSDVYRVLALDGDGGDLDARLSLPTRLPFLARLEAELSRAAAAADRVDGDEAAGDTADARSSVGGSGGGEVGAEELAMLRAIRAPAAQVAPTVPGGGGRAAAEGMLAALMAQHGSAEDEGVRVYLRRVAWIEQQKRIAAPPRPGEQAWASMTEAGRVQREMQHVAGLRKRFRRERKEKKE